MIAGTPSGRNESIPMRTKSRGSLVVLAILTLSQALLFGSLNPAHADAVMSVLKKYKRPYTLLEIGNDTCSYLQELPFLKRMVGAAIVLQGEVDEFVHTIQRRYPHTVSVMAPRSLTLSMLETLGRCEHFDVVIVHDISTSIPVPYRRLIAVLTALGDHVFISVESAEHEQILKKSSRIRQAVSCSCDTPSLFLSTHQKKGLDLARYTQVKSRSSQPRYEVISSYQHKEFTKKGLQYPLTWIHGINLVTFCMLYGVYPNDQVLRSQLRGFRKSLGEHNDLVLGNFILQGTRLFPIDSHDARRNADPYELLNAALEAFKIGNTRLNDPKSWIDEYYQNVKNN